MCSLVFMGLECGACCTCGENAESGVHQGFGVQPKDIFCNKFADPQAIYIKIICVGK